MIRITLAAGALTGALVLAPPLAAPAAALPGQCMYTPWGGFCDEYAWADGSFYHCESALGFSNCFQACHDLVANRAVPTDVDPRTPC
jgi:hypothetical protein